MLPNNTQVSNPQPSQAAQPQKPVLPVDQAMAHLGFANNMMEQLLKYHAKRGTLHGAMKPKAQPQAPQAPQAQAEPKNDKAADDARFSELEGKMSQGFEDMRNEFHASIQQEIKGIKEAIQEALNNEEDREA